MKVRWVGLLVVLILSTVCFEACAGKEIQELNKTVDAKASKVTKEEKKPEAFVNPFSNSFSVYSSANLNSQRQLAEEVALQHNEEKADLVGTGND
ncbi:MAG: hypothetical protein LKE40_04935 [Spirochaetia bacterium]|jgi:hypothetical protein|nr:hypothetical protein [Spirochaetia bacterium]